MYSVLIGNGTWYVSANGTPGGGELPPPAQTAPIILTTDLPGATAGSSYFAQMNASGSGPITWSVQSINQLQIDNSPLPEAFRNYIPVSYPLSGTSTTVTLQFDGISNVNNYYNELWIVVGNDLANPRRIVAYDANTRIASVSGTFATIPNSGTLVRSLTNPNREYVGQFSVLGGTPPYTWSKQGSAEIAYGLSFNSKQARIEGLLDNFSGTTNITITVTDSIGSTASRALSFTKRDFVPSGLAYLRQRYFDLPQGTVGVPYTTTLTASSTSSSITWKLIAGSLPTGLSFNPTTQVISGTPTQAGPKNFTIQLTTATGIQHYDLQIGVYGTANNTVAPIANVWRAG